MGTLFFLFKGFLDFVLRGFVFIPKSFFVSDKDLLPFNLLQAL